MKLIRDLLDALDSRIEDALTAHGFAFSALSADEGGALLRFDHPEKGEDSSWHLTFRLPRPGQPEIQLRHGNDDETNIALAIKVDGKTIETLAGALAIAMTLFTAVEQ